VKAEKHFLDTSVLIPLLTGTGVYKRYLKSQLADAPLYVSNYVLMEFRRTRLASLIEFYFVLDLPTLRTIGEALRFWSNQFKSSRHVAVEGFVATLLDGHKLDRSLSQDKRRALRVLADYIRRLERKAAGEFRNVGADSTRCGRAAVPLEMTFPEARESLKSFQESFDDLEACRSRCRIGQFVLERSRAEVQGYAEEGEKLPTNADTRGFKEIAQNLAEILLKGPQACSCSCCARIGDAVIALDAPREMRLEHTDNSFNYLCPPIGQPHQQHPSETAVVRGQSGP